MNPIIVIVPGSWHPAAAYTAFATALNNAGFPTHIASYPSLDPSDPTTATCQADATAIRSQLLQLLDDKNDESRDIIVLPHSYGGNPSAGAAHGLSKAAREREGKRGGVLGLVYMTAFCVPGGACTLDLLGGKHAPFVNVDHPRHGVFTVQNPQQVFYNDLPATEADRLVASLKPHALLIHESPAAPAAWEESDFKGKLAFLRCVKDNAIPLAVQDLFVSQGANEWIVRDIDAGHSPWASKVDETVEFVKECVGRFRG